jgi:alpha/beta superfamily hydrolase
MKEQPVTFRSGELTLEGLLAKPEGATAVRGGVVCHPHPLYGGSMYNNVVDAALAAMWKMGWATLRFNFRGVGRSEGEHGGGGAGEAADAAAAVDFLAGQSGVQPEGIVLAGYSFGAMAAAKAAVKIKGVGALVLVALPIRMADASALESFQKPILFAAGDNDTYCPASQLESSHKELDGRSHLSIIEGADHFFGGYEDELTKALEAMLTTAKL